MTWLDWLVVAMWVVLVVCVGLSFYALSKSEPWRIMTIERVEIRTSDPGIAERYKGQLNARGESS